MLALMVIMVLWPLVRNLSRRRARNASLIDLLASPQVNIRERSDHLDANVASQAGSTVLRGALAQQSAVRQLVI